MLDSVIPIQWIVGFVPVDFSKVQIGTKKVEDAIYELGDFKKANPRFGDKKVVLDAI